MTISEYRNEIIELLIKRLEYSGKELNEVVDSITDDVVEETISKGIEPSNFLADWLYF